MQFTCPPCAYYILLSLQGGKIVVVSLAWFRINVVTCGMIVSLERRSCSPIVAISIPSIKILPPALSRMRNKAKVRDDLPAPVRPTIPICWNDKIERQCQVLPWNSLSLHHVITNNFVFRCVVYEIFNQGTKFEHSPTSVLSWIFLLNQ